MGKVRTFTQICAVVSVVIVAQVECFPRKQSFADHEGRSSKLATVMSDYWSERGFHDAMTDHLLASESQGKELMLTSGDDGHEQRIVHHREKPAVRIPRGRLTPPGINTKRYNALNKITAASRQRQHLRAMKQRQHRMRYPHVRVMNHLVPASQTAQRKQDDMEILESVTLIDGGTPHNDGTITMQPSPQQSQRKYHQEHVHDDGQASPLNYHLQDDDLMTMMTYKQPQLQQSNHGGRQPAYSASYHEMPNVGYSPSGEVQGKLSLGQYKQPKSIPLSLNQYQQQLFHQQQQQAHLPPSTAKPQVLPIFVIPASKNNPAPPSLGMPPAPFSTPLQTTTTLPPPPPSPPSQQPINNPQAFQEQFQHPFATQPPSQLTSLAQLTATILSGASSIAAATSSAAAALAKGEFPIPTFSTPAPPAAPSQPSLGSEQYPSYAAFGSPPSMSGVYPRNPQQQPSQYEGLGPLSSGILSAASIPSASQVLLPTTRSPYDPLPVTSPRPGVIADAEQVGVPQNSLTSEPDLAAKITQLVETGRKILYFPKGVMDTMDVIYKQLERNPTVAYWGDKFFAKVFGDTSGT